MTVTLDLRPEIEARLAEHACARAVAVEEYLGKVVEEAVQRPTLEEFRTAMDQLADWGRGLPHLPDSALTRDSIYQDHD
jgi:hypothetical protein